ncbi:hypothetical protein [Actinomadura litoris]|uniref:hypothetical protein n=1 Tax=Actinomadura litoris TaxID=2678616 RepID=UPI001FA70A9E|nr:hypothetical protein [Actinomadura litoris]
MPEQTPQEELRAAATRLRETPAEELRATVQPLNPTTALWVAVMVDVPVPEWLDSVAARWAEVADQWEALHALAVACAINHTPAEEATRA